MRESETPPELLDWFEDDSSDSFVMVSSATGGGSTRGRFFASLTLAALVGVILVASSAAWVPTVQRQGSRWFPPPPYTGAVTVVQEQFNRTIWGLRPGSGKPQWSYKPVSNESAPLRVGDVVVAVEADGIVGIRSRDGYPLWHAKTPPGHAIALLNYIDTQQFIAWFPSSSEEGSAVYQARDAYSGAILWELTNAGFPILPPQGKDLLFCSNTILPDGMYTGHVSAFDVTTGLLHWQSPEVRKSALESQNCFISASLVYFTQEAAKTSELTAFSLATGALVWHHPYVNSLTSNDAQHFYTTNWYIDQAQSAAPVLTAYNLLTGAPLWHVAGRFTSLGLAPIQDTILPMKTATGIAGIDVRTGAVTWQFDPPEDSVQFWLAKAGEGTTIYYYTGGYVYAIDAVTGNMVWAQATVFDGSGFGQSDLVYRDQRVYLSTPRTFTAFDASEGRQLWQVAKSYLVVN
ncbi:MAG: PQQ-binding-like beta-propeller repeat protein [Ktedonobacterales bacterium]|nr:PQQ-binding-like beta-propeller repeat protein [Ktedonobacterales bacterium]